MLNATLSLDAIPAARQGKLRGVRPQIGLSVLVMAAAFPIRFGASGEQSLSLFDLAVIVCLVQLTLACMGRKIDNRPPRQIVVGILGPTLLTMASLWWSEDFGRTLVTEVSWIEAIIVLTFVTVTLGAEYPSIVIRWIARFGVALLIAPILMYLNVPGFEPPSQIDPLSADHLSYYVRFSHPFLGKSNNLATILAILFIPLMYWATRYHRHRLATLAVGVAILFTLSRGVIAALMVSGLFLTLLTRDRTVNLGRNLIILFGVALAVGVSIIATVPVIGDILRERTNITGLNGRQDLLSQGWARLAESPFIGYGGGSGQPVHNTLLQQMIDFGLPLGVLSVICLLQIPRWFFTIGDVNTPQHTLARACGWGIVAGFLTFLTESSLEGTLLKPVIFLCIGLCVALTQAGLRLNRAEVLGDFFHEETKS
jgi:hypothetical protein